MDFMDVVQRRRAVRDYTDEAVDSALVQSLIDTAILAPSAKNLQPWSFWVILGRNRVDELAAQVKGWLGKELREHGMYSRIEKLAANPGFSTFYHAPALVLVVATSQAPQALQDCCLAAELLMLAARNAGLGSCWIGPSAGIHRLRCSVLARRP
jgi:nitroreductase